MTSQFGNPVMRLRGGWGRFGNSVQNIKDSEIGFRVTFSHVRLASTVATDGGGNEKNQQEVKLTLNISVHDTEQTVSHSNKYLASLDHHVNENKDENASRHPRRFRRKAGTRHIMLMLLHRHASGRERNFPKKSSGIRCSWKVFIFIDTGRRCFGVASMCGLDFNFGGRTRGFIRDEPLFTRHACGNRVAGSAYGYGYLRRKINIRPVTSREIFRGRHSTNHFGFRERRRSLSRYHARSALVTICGPLEFASTRNSKNAYASKNTMITINIPPVNLKEDGPTRKHMDMDIDIRQRTTIMVDILPVTLKQGAISAPCTNTKANRPKIYEK
ncbi:hypothetical protein K438DRAFT_1753945 [Mycena galopus ATCC 62051]|nr:hypothetical protein K438DRAFT_1753945 [Mycena galopus ATCC 62051]